MLSESYEKLVHRKMNIKEMWVNGIIFGYIPHVTNI